MRLSPRLPFLSRSTALNAARLSALLAAALLAACTLPRGPAGAASAPAAASAPRVASAPAGMSPAQRAAMAAAAASAASAPAAPVPGQPPTFATVIKDTKKIDGLFAAWQKDEKVWLELQPSDFDKPFYLSPKIINGIGESGIFGGLMSRAVPQLVQFRRVYNQVQLVALNRLQVAKAGTPEARAVEAAASVSLLGSTPVGSQPHPDRKSVLIDAGSIFVGEMLGIGAQLQRTYRQGYGLDGRNSVITLVRGNPDLTVFEVNQHYATGQIAVPVPGASPPGAPVPTVPDSVPDARSLFVKLHYSLGRLPDKPMAPRAADPRIGHFVSVTDDFSDDLARSPRLRHVNRWRLEKAPVVAVVAAAASAPASAATVATAATAASAPASAVVTAVPASPVPANAPASAAVAAAPVSALVAAAPASAVVAAALASAVVAAVPASAAAPAAPASAAMAAAPASAVVAAASASAATPGLVPPVKPITFWLDRNIPVKYRAAISEGILEWNKAFERLGFAGAVQVRQQPDDADFDTLDMGIASIRWMANRAPQFGAIGPSHVDPRSGEILDADIAIEGLSSRNIRAQRTQLLSIGTAAGMALSDARAAEWARLLQVAGPPADADAALQCQHADMAAEQLAYALDVLAARGDLDPDSPEAQAFVLAYLKDTTMHEVGHTLGLRHNFRASRVVPDTQVRDPEFTRDHAFTGSVMEYAAINLPRPGEPPAAPFQTTLGPYDHWAIEYAYKPIAPEDEKAELARIAARSAEPELAYGTDEDNFLGIDPEALQFDLGQDPLAFAARRFDIAADLFKRQDGRALKPDQDYAVLRRSLSYALRDAARAAGVLLRQVGGVRTLRDFAGSGRDPMQPVPAAQQRAALAMLSSRLLGADAFAISPALQRRLAPDYLERGDSFGLASATEYQPANDLLELQRALLNRLMGDALAVRLLDAVQQFDDPQQALVPAELYARLEADVWSELGQGARPAVSPIAVPRRALQREHINRMAALVLRPTLMSRPDARALLRQRATALATRLEQGARRPGLDETVRLHLKDSAETLRAALAARLERLGA